MANGDGVVDVQDTTDTTDPTKVEVDDPEQDDETPDDEGGDTKGGDPARALRSERGKRKAASAKVKALEKELAEMKPFVEEYKNLLPILPQLLKGANGGGNGKVKETPQADPELVDIAKEMGFVDESGEPDVARADRVMKRLEARTGRVVNEATRGARTMSAQAIATQVRQKAYGAKDENGDLYASREAIDQVFNALPPEAAADPEMATLALIIARGLKGSGGKASEEPIFVEGAGRVVRGGPRVLSDLEKKIAQARGKNEKQWAALTPDDDNWVVE